jgi:hypothetical protein
MTIEQIAEEEEEAKGIPVVFAKDYAPGSFRLMMIPPTLSLGDKLCGVLGRRRLMPRVIRGDVADEAVLVSPSQTYRVRSCVSSNMTMLCAATDQAWVVQDTLNSVWDLEPVVGDQRVLWRMLALTYPKHTDGVAWDRIVDVVQASDAEIKAALKSRDALCMDGKPNLRDIRQRSQIDGTCLKNRTCCMFYGGYCWSGEVRAWICYEATSDPSWCTLTMCAPKSYRTSFKCSLRKVVDGIEISC